MPAPPPGEDELNAFVDGELSPARREAVAAMLRADPALAARVAAYRSDSELLRVALAGIVEAPLPEVWAAQIEAAMRSRPKVVTTRRFAVAASVVLAASLGVVAWWRWPRGDTIVTEAEAAREGHLDGRLEGDPLPPPATRDALLGSALGMHVQVPDLERFGFRLARLELFGPQGRRAAQLRYSDTAGRDLTIYVRSSDGTVRFDILRRGDTRVCVWEDEVVGAVIIARVSAAEMLHIATGAYTALNL
jgi:anti-sigma factor RsiW